MSIVNIKILKEGEKINKKVVIIAILICVLNVIYKIYSYSFKYKSDEQSSMYEVMIIEKQKQTDNKVVYLSKVGKDKFLLNIFFKDKYDESNNLTEKEIQQILSYNYGDYLKVEGKIVISEKLGNVGEFDYRKYLNSKGIYGTLNAYKVQYVESHADKLGEIVYLVRDKISNIYTKNLGEKQAGLLKGMIYGDTRNLDNEIKEKFQNIGISHITAVSGSNLNTLLIIMGIVMYKFNKKRIYVIIQIICIVMFCLISGLELSVLRAGIMTSILIIGKIKKVKINIFKLLLVTFAIMIYINPFRIFNVGMIMSFLSIIGLSLFSKKIYNFLESKIKWKVKNKKVILVLCKIANVVSITLAINITTLPITIYSFNRFSLINVLSNLLVSFLSDSICILGIISVILVKIPYLSTGIFYTLNFLISALMCIAKFLDKISFLINLKSIPFYIIVIYYLYIFVFALRKYILVSYKRFEKLYKKVKRGIDILFIFCILFWYINSVFLDNYVYFFNVGQGEMALVKENNTYVMIDCGSITNDTSYIFDSFAKKQNINKIDVIILSHFHSDHTNGIEKMLEKYKVSYCIYAYPASFENEEYIKTMEIIKENNIKSIMVKEKDNIKINNIDISVLSPALSYVYGRDNDESENINSLVFNLNIRKKNFLFTGDSVVRSETKILENIKSMKISKFDILKVAHHGSKTSTSDNFIQNILPKVAIISSKYKVYKHPSKQTINILNRYNVITYITEKCGGIKYII